MIPAPRKSFKLDFIQRTVWFQVSTDGSRAASRRERVKKKTHRWCMFGVGRSEHISPALTESQFLPAWRSASRVGFRGGLDDRVMPECGTTSSRMGLRYVTSRGTCNIKKHFHIKNDQLIDK